MATRYQRRVNGRKLDRVSEYLLRVLNDCTEKFDVEHDFCILLLMNYLAVFDDRGIEKMRGCVDLLIDQQNEKEIAAAISEHRKLPSQ